MDINIIRGIQTAVLLFAFIGLVIWVFSKKRKKDFDEAANLPFVDEATKDATSNSEKVSEGEKQ